MPENPFKIIEPNGQVPESLKKALVSEIDTIRNGSSLVELFVGNFVTSITVLFSAGNKVDNNETWTVNVHRFLIKIKLTQNTIITRLNICS